MTCSTATIKTGPISDTPVLRGALVLLDDLLRLLDPVVRQRLVVVLERHAEHDREGRRLAETVLVLAVGHRDGAGLRVTKAAKWHLTEHEIEGQVVLLVIADGGDLVGGHADLLLVPVEETVREEEEERGTGRD